MPFAAAEHLAGWLGGATVFAELPGHGHELDSQAAHAGAAGTGGVAGEAELRELSGGAVRVDLLNNNNSQYYGDFAVGSPKQRFTAIFDTGSAVTWLPGAKCNGITCQEHHRFDSAGSRSFEGPLDGKTAASGGSSGSIHYGTGEVRYEGGTDTLTFCDSHDNPGCHAADGSTLTVRGQPFGMSTHQTTYPFRILPFDGIMGLAPSASKNSVLAQLKAAKSLHRNVMGVYLSQDSHRTGSIDFGGVEPARMAPKSPLHWHKITNPESWEVSIKDIVVNGKPLHVCDARPGGVCPAVVDTGSSLISGPTGEIDKLLSKIRTKDDCSNLGKMPQVSLQLQDRDGKSVLYPLTPEEYTLKSLEEVPNTGDSESVNEFPVLGTSKAKAPEVQSRCEPGFGVMDVPGRKWVLGDTFLRRYYSIYDDDRGLVGFVRSIHADEAPAPAAPPPDASQASVPGLLGMAAPLLQGCLGNRTQGSLAGSRHPRCAGRADFL